MTGFYMKYINEMIMTQTGLPDYGYCQGYEN